MMGIVTALSITLLNNWTARAQCGTAWHSTACFEQQLSVSAARRCNTTPTALKKRVL
jgi:hypothetical protein